ncbi:tRNA pseudouridine synthase 1 [Borealophlyctis nickersoniae]|nr:tRNA pseudouridine synthase 1 [Borealophlyctis nickersoniae]
MITKDKEIVQKLNALLPPQIRIWGYVKVSKPFHAKNTCDSRIYEYLLPTYVLQPCSPVLYPRSGVGESARMTVAEEDGDAKSVAEDDYAKTVVNEDDTMTVVEENEHKVFDIPKMNAEELNRKRSYRAPAHQLEKLEMLLNQYAGFHNFHNFTNGMKFSDKKAMRLIKSFECSKPFIRDDLEWVSCKVHGQSFMLHQIRKMIGLVIMMMRTGTGVALIRQAFREERLNIPKAPSLGLLLEQVVYHKYGGTGPHSHIQRRPNSWEPVNFDKYKDEIEAFKEKWIYSGIAAEEAQDAVFNEWLRVIDSRPGDYAWYLNKDGSIHLDRRPKNMLGKGREGV